MYIQLKWAKKTCYLARTASLSHVIRLLLSKQSSINARTNFSSQVLVLPAKERFSFTPETAHEKPLAAS